LELVYVLGIGSISGHHFNNSRHGPLDIFVKWNGIMSFVIFMSFHVSTSYRNELLSFTSWTFGEFVFSLFWYKQEFITCYRLHHIIIILWHKFIYFNVTCHWHMNMCCLIRLHVDMLTFFKKLSTKEQMSMQKGTIEICLLYLPCGNNHDGIIPILCMVFNLLFEEIHPRVVPLGIMLRNG
jgi:hypothetical protein